MGWRETLRELISERWKPGETFGLDEVYEFEPRFQELFPNNSHIRADIRLYLQHLRNDGLLDFLGRGRYRLKQAEVGYVEAGKGMRWIDILRDLITKRWEPGDSFSLTEIYDFEPHLKKLFPNNRHIQNCIQLYLQKLRDEGTIQFEQRGHYRLLSAGVPGLSSQITKRTSSTRRLTNPARTTMSLTREAISAANEIGKTVKQVVTANQSNSRRDPETCEFYAEIIKPAISSFKTRFGETPNMLLKRRLTELLAENRLEAEYEVSAFQYFGQILRPYVWACVTPRIAGSLAFKCSYLPQLALVINDVGFRFGFAYGDYVLESSDVVTSIALHRDLLGTLLEAINEGEIQIYPRLGDDDSFEAIAFTPASVDDLAERWHSRVFVGRSLKQEDVPDDIESVVHRTFERVLPLFLAASARSERSAERLERTRSGRSLASPSTTTTKKSSSERVTKFETVGGLAARPSPILPTAAAYPLTKLCSEAYLSESTAQRILRAIERKKRAVLYGPPGTGKTYLAVRLARHLIAETDGFMETVQFHPSYGYEDFIEGIRPESSGDRISYPIKAGSFLDFCDRARTRGGPCVLIIDEINRADLSRVFGELLFVLEDPEREVRLASGRLFSIPDTVILLGTMNTADRSIALVDHALRRRFAFIALRPDYEILRAFHEVRGLDVKPLIELLRGINAQINDPHYELGISFFLVDELREHLPDIWTMEIEPYLEEYFFDQREAVDELRWPKVSGRLWS